MSSSWDVGRTLDDARKIEESKCEESPDGKHDWEHFGSWPSTWSKCKHCGKSVYSK